MILCIGQSCYDLIFPIHEPLIENQKYRIYEHQECIGAPALNAASLIARWQEPVGLISRVGNDVYGKLILDGLAQLGVDTQGVTVDEQFSTPLSAVIPNTLTGSRTIFNRPGVKNPCTFTFPKGEINVLLMDGYEMQASKEAMATYPHAKTIIDAGSYKGDTRELGKHVDYLVCSQDFACQCTNHKLQTWEDACTIYAQLKAYNPREVIVTLGERGCLYEHEGTLCHLPAYQVDVLDTTGAGDIFHGAFAWGIAKGLSLPETLRISSAAAGLSVGVMGGQTSIPSLQAVQKLMREGNRYPSGL